MVAYFGLAIYWSCFHTKRRDVALFGFIGVGQMGGGLARNLIRAGKEVLVYDLNPEAGIDPKYLIELLDDTGAKSFQMDVRGPWIANSDFASGFGLDLALKHVRLGCGMAEAWAMRSEQ